MWVTKLLIFQVKKDFLPQNDQIWFEIGIFVHCRLIWCPVDGTVDGCGARALSRKTPIYFILFVSPQVHLRRSTPMHSLCAYNYQK